MTTIATILMTTGLRADLLAQRGEEGSNIYEWAFIIFVIAFSILTSLVGKLKKTKQPGGQGQGEDEDEVRIDLGFPRPGKPRPPDGTPVARRPRPPVVARRAGQPASTKKPPARRPTPRAQPPMTRPAPPAPVAKRRPASKPPARQPQPVKRPAQRRQQPAAMLGQAAVEHARQVAAEAAKLARHAEQATSRLTERHVQPATTAPETLPEPSDKQKALGLASIKQLRRAIVLREIFSSPVALRDDPQWF